MGGWTEGFISEGWDCVGFDIERHQYGDQKYPGQLVLQDVLTIHGSQFKNADCIVASPPCQQYSWLAMPWSRSKDPNNSKAAKALRAKWELEGPDNRLFDACFRIQREAIEAAGGRYIPLIVENVRGAQPWVGRSAWNFGSFHLWGDVPALMPINLTRRMKSRIDCSPRLFSERIAGTPEEAHALHYRLPDAGTKNNGGSWFAVAHNTESGHSKNPVHELAGQKVPAYSDPRRNGGKGVHLTSPHENSEGLKIGGDWFRDPACHSAHGSRSSARKAASAQIAKIPLALSSWIARVYKPRTEAAA